MNSKVLFVLLIAVCSVFLFSCTTSKPVFGTYKTNFADLGFFGTTLTLKPDSSFKYTFAGDLIHDSGVGYFTIRKRKLFLDFASSTNDTTPSSDRFTLMPQKSAFVDGREIRYKELLYLGHEKLFFGHADTERKVTRARKYNKRRQFLLFGSHYYKRRWFLSKYP